MERIKHLSCKLYHYVVWGKCGEDQTLVMYTVLLCSGGKCGEDQTLVMYTVFTW